MFRDLTFTDVSALENASDVRAGLMMDEEEFRGFYERTAKGVWVYLVRITGDRQMADDLLQEAFYRFLRANAVHESEAHRRNSLYRIATNLARDTKRRSWTHPLDAAAGGDVEMIATPDYSTAAEKRTDCARAMAFMKPRDRAMLWLAYAEGASHREIAETLGLRPASMKLLLFRARRRLAALLQGSIPEGRK